MPQPLSKISPKAEIVIGPRYITRYPKLSVHILTVIAHASQADAYWTHILAHLLEKEARTVLAMYAALTGGEGRRAMVLGAARAKLDDETYSLFEAVYSATRAVRKQRNDFAHHLWGTATGLKNALVLVDPKDEALAHLAVTENYDSGTFKLMGTVIEPCALDPKFAQVYRKGDFERAAKAAEVAEITVWELFAVVLSPGPGATRTRLSSRPLVKEALQKKSREPNSGLQQSRRPEKRRGKSR